MKLLDFEHAIQYLEDVGFTTYEAKRLLFTSTKEERCKIVKAMHNRAKKEQRKSGR